MRLFAIICLLLCHLSCGRDKDTNVVDDPQAKRLKTELQSRGWQGGDHALLASARAVPGDLAGVCRVWNPTTLDLSNVTIPDDYIAELKTCSRLERISLGPATLKGAQNFPHLVMLPSLKSLVVDRAPLTDTDVLSLPDLPALETISLTGYLDLSNTSVAHITQICPNLKDLAISGKKIDRSAFDGLLKLKSLEEISVNGTQITKEELLVFADEYEKKYGRRLRYPAIIFMGVKQPAQDPKMYGKM